MQEKLIDILSRATAWMTAQQIADAGGWRSASNVTVALQQMEKASGKVEHRKSQTELMANGLPATEWKLTDKKINDATKSKMGRKPKHPPLEKVSSEADELRKQIADLHAESAGFCSLIEDQRNQIAKLNEQLMTGEEDAVDVKEASFFAVFRPRRGLQRFKKLETAKAEAEVGARIDGQAELYAMVLVDVAKTGAVWEGKKSRMSTIANDVALCSGDNCPSRNNCRRYTDRSTAGNMTPHAAFWARREAGANACESLIAVNPISTLKEA